MVVFLEKLCYNTEKQTNWPGNFTGMEEERPMSNKKTFRSALNGFNREDVVHYIEYINAQHSAQVNQLTAELEQLRGKLAEVPEAPAAVEIPDVREELQAAAEENARLEARLQAMLEEKTELEEQLRAALSEKYQAVLDRDAALAKQVNTQSRMEEELEAYRRAERAERLAKERAEKVYHQVNGVLADATVKVDEAAATIGGLSDQVMAQLNQLQTAVVGSKQALEDAVNTMYALRPTEE